MKNFRMICLLLALVMAASLALAGCSEKDSTAPSSTPTTSTAETSSTSDDIPDKDDKEPQPPTYDPEDPEPTMPPAPELDPPELEDDIDDDFKGKIDGKSYTNNYIGIACALSDDWQIFGNQLGAASTGHAQFYDMQAENTKNNATMHVTLSNLTQLEQAAYGQAPDEEVVDIALTGSELHAENYAQAGITVESMVKEKFTFLGEERWTVFTTGNMLGASYYIVQIFEYDLGPCGATITVAGFSQKDVQDTLDLFQSATA